MTGASFFSVSHQKRGKAQPDSSWDFTLGLEWRAFRVCVIAPVCMSFRGVPPLLLADVEESRTAMKTLKARFQSRDCGMGMIA